MKRKYCDKKMSLLMKAYETSQMSSDAFAVANSIPKSTFYKWRIKYQKSLRQTGKNVEIPEFATIPVETLCTEALPEGTKQEKKEAFSATSPTNTLRRLIITTPSGLRLELDV